MSLPNKNLNPSKNNTLKVLFLGDIVGRPGREAVTDYLAKNRAKAGWDLVLANGENLASGKGITFDKYEEMIRAGIDYLTSGNHVWSFQAFVEHLDDKRVKVLRPANYPKICPGFGEAEIEIDGLKITLINLQGQVFMRDNVDNPFLVADKIIKEHEDSAIIVDFHAEATSEKIALGYHLDGRVAAVLGTHTHVQTADEKVLAGGTGYITDLGMCGPFDSVLGVRKEIIIKGFLTQLPQSHKVAVGKSIVSGVEIEIDKASKKTISIKRICEIFNT
jgi:metallophosphoesterase (TIGR00282 family)